MVTKAWNLHRYTISLKFHHRATVAFVTMHSAKSQERQRLFHCMQKFIGSSLLTLKIIVFGIKILSTWGNESFFIDFGPRAIYSGGKCLGKQFF